MQTKQRSRSPRLRTREKMGEKGVVAVNFRQLEYVIEVYRCGSINKAAGSLFVSQPAVSSAIHDLEAELGFPIFERSSKGITGTAEGKQFIAAAQQIVRQVNQIQNGGIGNDEESPMILRISSGRYSFLSKAAVQFCQEELADKPQFSLYINESGNTDVVQDVFNRRADLGFIHIKNADEASWKKRLESRNMEHVFLFQAKSCVTFRKSHPLNQKKDFSLEELFQYPQIRTTSRMAEYCNLDTTQPFSIYESFEKNIFTNNRSTLYDLLSCTDAVFLGITSQYVTEFHPDLVTIPLPQDDSIWNIYYVKLKNVPLQPAAARFLSILQKLIPNTEPGT